LRLCRAVVCKRTIGNDGRPVLAQLGYLGTYTEGRAEDTEEQAILDPRQISFGSASFTAERD